jgi:glucan endo-1,3-beta-D-glucosidase
LYRISEFGVDLGAGLGPGLGPKELVGFIRDVKESIQGTVLANKPIGHVDVWSAWANKSNSAVIDEIDFIGADIYPYYEKDRGNSFDNVTNLYDFLYGEVEAAAGDTPIWITETGYPLTGPRFGDAETGVDLAQTYWEEIGCGKIFGSMNVWWYNLRDSNPANKEKFAITEEDGDRKLSDVPRFNLTCPAGLAEDGPGPGPGPTNTDAKGSDSAAVRIGSAFVGAGVAAFAALLL